MEERYRIVLKNLKVEKIEDEFIFMVIITTGALLIQTTDHLFRYQRTKLL
jgi:hypothetical protein